ncbi:ABC transporter ATP-binding protein [Parvicella tangerina]|uniref:Lipoprotein-releasing system ATP-binding protein LolD n=1 Tax=Parvicella tangerina TaxID=2829795 RepID=A0A916NB66_9FLAO|nr:ABC transporter ATP-binding protein [Parvicella tangerina]CAG5082337.1 Lipoprotein-releasing system ATP-binding protein LolD [Parvicella tangerina]
MIEVKNIRKNFDDLEVLKGVNLMIQKGEIVSIVGASGAGKTTLLQILGTLDKADSGDILFEGTSIMKLRKKALSEFRNDNIGFVFQFHHLLPEFTALENVVLPALIGNKNKKEAEKRAKDLLGQLGLSERLNHKPAQLSGGEQQRTSVARALINNPKLILADEPSGNLDSENADELHELFFKLREETNQTFVIVTHNEDLADMADRKILMKDGVTI